LLCKNQSKNLLKIFSLLHYFRYYTTYDKLKEKMQAHYDKKYGRSAEELMLQKNTWWVSLSAGFVSRTFVAFVIAPMEYLRTHLQASPKFLKGSGSMSEVLTSILSGKSPNGTNQRSMRNLTVLWRGLVPTLWRDGPFR
jgi:hypothetical protein